MEAFYDKKIILPILCTLLFFALLPQAAYAVSNVSDINVDVGIIGDGSAYITQTWNCDFNEGAEGYIPIENLGEMSISNFRVSDENGAYQLMEDWEVGASFKVKSRKCGIVETSEGYELCWGISSMEKNTMH
ncbi:MAG: hypothetical protein PHU31_08575 [Anaerotignum sp.]|nr:hypothetical protein [Anaerotignum sp.]